MHVSTKTLYFGHFCLYEKKKSEAYQILYFMEKQRNAGVDSHEIPQKCSRLPPQLEKI